MMKKTLTICVSVLFFSVLLFPQTSIPPKREFRAVWLATVTNIDWPSTSTLSAASQKAEAIAILDKHKQSNINAILLQVRPSCDAFYQGGLEPLSEYLVGVQGGNLSSYYDPLQFWIDEAHKRGMELHCWFNPYRAVVSSGSSVHSTHISKTHPEWIITYGSSPYKLLNPGIPDVQNYVVKVIMDVVRRYNIDGVHFDDYFYPYGGMTSQDTATFSAFKGGFTNIADWRRNNVNKFIAMVYDSIKVTKPWVKFGVSPFGIWKSGQPVSGLDAYSAIYCDAINWLQNQKVDYITPQMYWKIAGAQDYSVLMPWWSARLNGRHLYSGNAVYRLTDAGFTTANNASEIQNQIELNRVQSRALGFVAFSSKSVTGNLKGVQDSLRANQFRYPALQPTMPWLDSVPPVPPVNIAATLNANSIHLQWQKALTAADGDSAKGYVVYSGVNSAKEIDITNSKNIRTIDMSGAAQYDDPVLSASSVQYQAVITSVDKLWNESLPNGKVYVVPAGKPFMLVSDAAVDIGDAAIGSQASGSITIFNRAATVLTIDSSYSSSSLFSAAPGTKNVSDSTQLTISYAPKAFGTAADTLYVKNNSLLGTVRIAVKGNSPQPQLQVVSNFILYGNVNIGDSQSKTVSLTNQSINSIRIDSIGFAVSSRNKFQSLISEFPLFIKKGDTTAFNVKFAPDSLKVYLDTLIVYSNASNSPSKVVLYGAGIGTLSVDRGSLMPPTAYNLYQNFPNPFNPVTTVSFTLKKSDHTVLKIYDLLGREVATVVDELLGAGYHQYSFDGSTLSSGVYLYRIISGDFVQTRKMVLQK